MHQHATKCFDTASSLYTDLLTATIAFPHAQKNAEIVTSIPA